MEEVLDQEVQDPPQKKYKVSQQVLSDFNATVTAKPNLTQEQLLSKFPEFNNDITLLQSAYDYSATSKSGKYKTVDELNSKFPEFEFTDLKKNGISGNGSANGGTTLSQETEPVDHTGLIDVKAEAAKFEKERGDERYANNFGLASPKELALDQMSNADNTINKSVESTIVSHEEKKHHDELAKRKTEKVDKALNNTASKSLQLKGIKAEVGSPQFNAEKEKYKKALESGQSIVGIDKHGNEGLRRVTGVVENWSKGWNNAVKGADDANRFVNAMSVDEMVNYAETTGEAQKPNEYIGETPSALGSASNYAAGTVPFLGKAAVGAGIGALSIAGAPESLGASLAGLPVALAFMTTAPDMANQGAMAEIMSRYQILKQQNPGASKAELMQEARNGAYAGGIGGILTNAALMGTGLKTPLSLQSKNALVNTLTSMAKSGVHMGAIGGTITAAQGLEGELEGIHKTPEEHAKAIAQSIEENATTGVILTGVLHGLPNLLKSVAKYAIVKSADKNVVAGVLKANENVGNVPEGTTDKVVRDIQEFTKALGTVTPNLTPESEASVAGLIQKRTHTEQEAEGKDVTAKPFYQQQIDVINQQIAEIQRTNRPLEHEIDEATGETFAQPTFDEVQKQRVEDLAKKISSGKRIEDAEDLQTQASFPGQLETELKRIAGEEKAANAGKENPKTDVTDNINKYLKSNETTEAQTQKTETPQADEASITGSSEGTGTVTEITETKTEPIVKEEKPAKEKGVMAKARGIEDLTNPIDIVLQHFTGGGKIHHNAIKELFGGKDERIRVNASTESERRRRIGLLSSKTGSIDDLAHKLWESQPEHFQDVHTTQDFKEAIETVLQEHNSPASMAKELVNKYINKSIEEHLTEEEFKDINESRKKDVLKYLDEVPEDQQHDLLKLLSKYQDQYGFIDWKKLEEDSSGFDPDILSLSEQTAKSLDEIIQKNNSTGQGEHGNLVAESNRSENSQIEGNLKSAQSDYDRATKELKSAEDKISKKQATQTGMFGEAAQKEMFGVGRDEAKEILDPLRKKVKETKTALDKAQTEFNNLKEAQPDLFEEDVALNKSEVRIANELPKATAKEIIDSKGLTLENIDKPEIKKLFEGFPFSKEDFEKVKNQLNEKGHIAEPEGNERQGTGLPEDQAASDKSQTSPQPETKDREPTGGSSTGEVQPEGEASQVAEPEPPLPENKIEQAGISAPFVNEFFKEDVNPIAKRIGLTLKDTLRRIVNTLSPTTGVSEKAITHLMKALGGRNEAIQAVDKAMRSFEKVFDKMKDPERIDFIDRMKTGKPQSSPEMQAMADALAAMDKNLYDEITKYKPGLTWKENHYRVLWKVIPGQVKEKIWSNLTRRPFRGSQGFAKKATLTDMSEGMARGGVPQSTNPITMFKLSYADAMKFITAQRMFEALKDDGMIKFVKKFGTPPEGFVKIDDAIGSVYFKADAGLIETGNYYIEEGAGRLLNNHLSRDYVRESMLGKGMMDIKNLYTQIELGLSGFHAVAESLETVSSDFAIGLRKLINLGTRGDFKSAGQGILDILKAPFSPKTTFTAGRNAIKLASIEEFENSKFGQAYLKKTPAAKEYLHDFFVGGGIMKQHEDLKANTFKALKEHTGKDNYIGAAIRALPAMNEAIMNPLFNYYIPALKVGLFMKEWPVALKENQSRLAKGTITREELARKSVAFIDDRLGEMNFDNLFWNRTFKTSMQFMMRSVTWKLGNLRAMGGAPVEQAKEFVDAAREKRAPMLMPKMAWLFGLTTTTVALAATVQYLATGKQLQSIKDIVAPQINPGDPSERVVIPTYYKDVLHLWHSPSQYVKTSASGPFSKLFDIWNNKDFYNYEIHDEHDSWLEKRKDDLLYFVPKPFSISSATQMMDKGEPASKVALSFFGLNKAPGYLTHSDIENEIFDLYNIRHTNTKPQSEREGQEIKKEIRKLYKEGEKKKAHDLGNKAVKDGILKVTQISFLFQRVDKAYNPSVYFFNSLPFVDREHLFKRMTDDEKKIYDPKGKFARKVKH